MSQPGQDCKGLDLAREKCLAKEEQEGPFWVLGKTVEKTWPKLKCPAGHQAGQDFSYVHSEVNFCNEMYAIRCKCRVHPTLHTSLLFLSESPLIGDSSHCIEFSMTS